MDRGAFYSDLAGCVDDTINNVGKEIVLGLPVGVGKPTHIANEFYRRAREDSKLRLTIISGLTLRTPSWGGDLERRLIQPLAARLFPDYPDPKYLEDAASHRLPENVELREIYFSPGACLNNPRLQQSYLSANYTHVARDVAGAGCNVVAVILSARNEAAGGLYSTGSNADAAIMMLWNMVEKRRSGCRVGILGQVNGAMPYMFGAGEVAQDCFTGIVDNPQLSHGLFAAPKEPIPNADYFIALHAGALVRDGGTFQVGFGSLADAVVYSMQLRHERNDVYRRILSETGVLEKFGAQIETLGGVGPFEKGLYGCSEFIFDGFVRLMDSGIIKRRVYDNEAVQRLLSEGRITETVTPEIVDILLADEVISPQITERQFRALQKVGIFKESFRCEGGEIVSDDGDRIHADLTRGKARDRIVEKCLGDTLKNGILIHAGFFIGSRWFYDALAGMDDARRRDIRMREISFVNALPGEDTLKMLQRRDSRFINSCMMATLMGGTASDTLESGQVVSGVGGQYNFVSMAHELPGARSILALRSSREMNGRQISNLVWTYGNLTIPRHLRDMFATEYGIADVRGRTDKDTIIAMLNIADSRFQPELLKKAKENGKLPESYEIPPAFRNNFPERLDAVLKPLKKEGFFPTFPYGTELTKEELILAGALRGLKKKLSMKEFRVPSASQVKKILSPPAAAKPFLERMQLDRPAGFKEKITAKLVLYALASENYI
jgi:acyl-CoA hydrolase